MPEQLDSMHFCGFDVLKDAVFFYAQRGLPQTDVTLVLSGAQMVLISDPALVSEVLEHPKFEVRQVSLAGCSALHGSSQCAVHV